VVVSPADGRITDVTALEWVEHFRGPPVRIGIYLSLFNVHVNRCPVARTVLLDIGLPGMDGYEVARQLRADPELEGMTLWALSGYTPSEADRLRPQQAGSPTTSSIR
jgi:CheY-like chemotaxis protein